MSLALSENLMINQQCRLGHHVWMPWLLLHDGNGVPSRYVTYCVHCRHHEQYDL